MSVPESSPSSVSPPSPGNATPSDPRSQLRAWVLQNGQGLTDARLGDDTPLFAGRFLSSLHLPELILTLERLRGRRIDPRQLKPESFRDLRALYAVFLEEQP